MRLSSCFAVVTALFLLSLAAPASATEIQLATGPQLQGSSWRGDVAPVGALKLGARFKDLVAVDTLTRLGYATVDQRVLTYLSLGATLYGRLAEGRLRPFVRLALVHQHEEPTPAIRHDPTGAVFGVGDGIRHRGGFASSLGTDVVVARTGAAQLVIGADVNGTWFPDVRGPAVYYGGGLWAGLDYSL